MLGPRRNGMILLNLEILLFLFICDTLLDEFTHDDAGLTKIIAWNFCGHCCSAIETRGPPVLVCGLSEITRRCIWIPASLLSAVIWATELSGRFFVRKARELKSQILTYS